MEVDPKTAAGNSEYRGQTCYFCAPGCKQAFDRQPEQYISQEGGHSGTFITASILIDDDLTALRFRGGLPRRAA